MQIGENTLVEINFTLKNGKGEVLDSTKDNEPMTYTHGTGFLVPALEAALEGKQAGDKVLVEISPKDGYGERSEEMVQKAELDKFGDAKEHVVPGAKFQMNTPQGMLVATVISVEGQEVTLDLNHPLAGMDLIFDVEILKVCEAPVQHDGGGCGCC